MSQLSFFFLLIDVIQAQPRLKRLLDPHTPPPLPRQFEYHPLLPDRLLVGSSTGELSLINPETGARISSVLARTGHAMLGLSWLRSPSHSHLCVAGSDDGSVGMWAAEGRSFKRVVDFPPFSQLTSLNVNCTDDRCVASGMHLTF